ALNCSCYFFFSSRRRHTRSYGDWSSDVCSSDLCSDQRGHGLARSSHHHLSSRARSVPPVRSSASSSAMSSADRVKSKICAFSARSEERRVGKGGISRWTQAHL